LTWRLADRLVSDCAADLRQLLADSESRTFNRITVELYDVTADVVAFEAPDQALWLLVAGGEVEHTIEAPIKFRQREGAPRARALTKNLPPLLSKTRPLDLHDLAAFEPERVLPSAPTV